MPLIPTENAWAKFESSAVSLEEFDELFADESEKMGHRISGKDVVAVLSGSLRPRMVETLKRCKNTTKLPASPTTLRQATVPA